MTSDIFTKKEFTNEDVIDEISATVVNLSYVIGWIEARMHVYEKCATKEDVKMCHICIDLFKGQINCIFSAYKEYVKYDFDNGMAQELIITCQKSNYNVNLAFTKFSIDKGNKFKLIEEYE